MGFFSTKHWVPVELPKIFAYFSDPNNLPKIMPSELDAQVLSINLIESQPPRPEGVSAGVGTTITFSFRAIPLLPIRQKWVAQILAFNYSPESARFQDRQLRGPFKSWIHIHGFEAENRDGQPGTLITDKVEFEIGYGPIGRWMDKWITERIRQTFVHRQSAVEAQFGPS